MRPTILAMDLEGTLISNAVSQIPRPGLCSFLETVNELFEHLVIYTSVPEPAFRTIAALLVGEGRVPAWFAQLPYTNWSGATKDLRHVSPILGAALLLDDYKCYIHPGQEAYWVEADLFASPYGASDNGLDAILGKLRQRLTAIS
ncbi:TPA: NIF family HAD-type phosphatase [Stenotrophomonas maltophilia]|uniref:NIF family HAD-type phosphatase n=1 Tax=Stenotrophomonas TaxID=40323 RepID=UPI000C14D605|nr:MULTISPECIES: NIF family HAD-type phosphatase [Stenotrophomonas]